jgi:hypothetical protein
VEAKSPLIKVEYHHHQIDQRHQRQIITQINNFSEY